MSVGKYEGLILQARQPSALSECVHLASKSWFSPHRERCNIYGQVADCVGSRAANPNSLCVEDLARSFGVNPRPFVAPRIDSFRDFLRADYGLEGGKLRSAVSTGRRDLYRMAVLDDYVDAECQDKYVSNYVLEHWVRQKKRGDDFLRSCTARSLGGGKSIALDPEKIKRARASYIAARMDGLPFAEDGAYHAMLTLNLPPEYHRTTHWDAKNKCKLSAPRKNDGWNGMQPYEAMDVMRANWAKARANWAKSKLRAKDVRGCRFVEPHRDGTPHCHVIVSVMSIEHLDKVVEGVANAWYGAGQVHWSRVSVKSKHGVQWQYSFGAADGYVGTRAMLTRLVKVDVMQDAAGACRYVDVYVRKNAGDNRVQCWLSVHNIRQYSFFGGGLKKKVWDAMGAAGMREKVQGRDGTGEYDSWAKTECTAVERGINVLSLGGRPDLAGLFGLDDKTHKSVMVDRFLEVLHVADKWELIKPDCGDVVANTTISDSSNDNRGFVSWLSETSEERWLGENGYRHGVVRKFGAWQSKESGKFVPVDSMAVRRDMLQRMGRMRHACVSGFD